MEYFGEDVVESMGKYYWRKKDKFLVKRGSNRAKDNSSNWAPPLNHIIWKSNTIDIQQGAVDTSSSMGGFASAKFNSVSQLSLDLEDKDKEM